MSGNLEIEWCDPSFTHDGGNDTGAGALELHLRNAGNALIDLPVSDIAAVFDDLSDMLLDRKGPFFSHFPDSGVPFLGQFCRAANISSAIADSLGDINFLDTFLPRPEKPQVEARAFPRGLVLHWLAGNVPTLGVLSLFSSMMTKNASLVRLPSGANGLLAEIMRQLSAKGGAHEVVANAVAVLRFDYRDRDAAESVSRAADVRIVWGSDETIKSVKKLPSKTTANDIVFPDRTSFAIIARSQLDDGRLAAVTRRLAQDVSLFEQKACASPHTVFLATDDDADVDGFCEALGAALDKALETMPKRAPDSTETSAILNLRSQYGMFHKVWHSRGLEWSILADDGAQLGTPIGSRTVYVRKMPPIDELARVMPENVQSVGIADHENELADLTSRLGIAGVHRFVPIGAMTNFDLPWDGQYIPQALVRWTSRPAGAGGGQ